MTRRDSRAAEAGGQAPIQARYRDKMNVVASALDDIFNPDRADGKARETGFVLLVFPFGTKDGQRCNYISNGADRNDMKAMFREITKRWEGVADVEGGRA